jgi:hypothetical protein
MCRTFVCRTLNPLGLPPLDTAAYAAAFVEASWDLVRWQDLLTQVAVPGGGEVFDSTAPGEPVRYYRVREQYARDRRWPCRLLCATSRSEVAHVR